MTVLNAVNHRIRTGNPLMRLTDLAGRAVLAVSRLLPAFFLCFADLLGMPSGLHMSLMIALVASRSNMVYALLGGLLGMLMRLLWGITPHWELLVSMLLVLPLVRVLPGKGNGWLTLSTALVLLPLPAVAGITGTTQDALLAVGAVAVAVFSTPVMYRAVQAIRSTRAMSCMEERLAVGYLAAMIVAGGGRLMLFGIHLGVLAAGVLTCALGMYLGVAAGMAAGFVGGLMLAMQGVPVEVSIALAMGGFMAGMAQHMGKRWMTCLAFGTTTALALLVTGTYGYGYLTAVITTAVVVALLPQLVMERARTFLCRFAPVRQLQGDAYAAAALTQWEKTVAELAATIPDPTKEEEMHDGAWWQQHLCCECPDRASCQVMASALPVRRVGEVWQARHAPEDEWQEELERLRGLGCGRLYCLRGGMDQLRRDELTREQWVKRAAYERDMLVTHLTAMAGAARHYALLSAGASWWDETSTRRVRQVLNESAFPATLLYVRKVEEHAVAAMETHSPGEARKLQLEMANLLSVVLGRNMMVSGMERDRVYFQECPVYQVEVGMSGRGADNRQGITGDAAYTGSLPNGCFLAVLSDGMGQGKRAGEESAITVKLLRLCMEAGYTRDQALGAVNGMMLLETGGERFATADLLTIDLWSGQANLDKLGAAGSWLLRGATLAEVTGDALPVGVLETVESRSSLLRLKDGDRVALVTDGVEDAYGSRSDLENAIRTALDEPDPNAAAERLVEDACEAAHGERRDDVTAVVLQITKRQRDCTSA